MNPSILWAQDRTHLFITLEIPDFNNQEILFSSTNVYIKGTSDKINYEYKIDLYNEIDSNNSSWVIKKNCIELKILKSKAYYWQKLTKVKKNNIKIDWQRWKDEDDDEDDNGLLTDFSNFRETLPEEFLNQNLNDFINLNSNEINDDSENNNEIGEVNDDDSENNNEIGEVNDDDSGNDNESENNDDLENDEDSGNDNESNDVYEEYTNKSGIESLNVRELNEDESEIIN
uniref:CS domain protein n=1 Tax=Mimiviridae sp. ChoanoV1 TaxID=2596887 RepID=A0A5B8IP72_9VIRU|nr:CS domain protein [Mimiviridae sp. ChoanoV1]